MSQTLRMTAGTLSKYCYFAAFSKREDSDGLGDVAGLYQVQRLSFLDYPLEVALMTRFEEIEQYAESEDAKKRVLAAAKRRRPVWTGK